MRSAIARTEGPNSKCSHDKLEGKIMKVTGILLRTIVVSSTLFLFVNCANITMLRTEELRRIQAQVDTLTAQVLTSNADLQKTQKQRCFWYWVKWLLSYSD